MTPLNTIIEEEKERIDIRNDLFVLTKLTGLQQAIHTDGIVSKVEISLTTTIQRAYEAGEKKGREEERVLILAKIARIPKMEFTLSDVVNALRNVTEEDQRRYKTNH